jgi:hydroxymethylpyrimidine pyrophosphatase-like HAD family hydrolase
MSYKHHGGKGYSGTPRISYLDVDGHLCPFGSRSLTKGVPEVLGFMSHETPGGYAVVTGRSSDYAKRFFGRNGCRAIASEQGTNIEFPDGERISYRKNLDDVKKVKDVFESGKKGEFFTYRDSSGAEVTVPFVEEPGKEVIYTMSLDPLRVKSLRNAPPGAVEGYASSLGEYVKRMVRESNYDVSVVVNKDSVEIVPGEKTKGWAMDVIGRRLGIPHEHAFAGGDSRSDLPMIEKAGFSGTVGNASDDFKSLVREYGGLVSDEPHGRGFIDNCSKIFRFDI